MDIKSGYGYLRAIYSLKEDGKEITTTSIAKILNVKPASVSEMLSKLGKNGLVAHEKYKGVKLTAKGENEATKAIRRHRLIEDFLVRILKVTEGEVLKQADAMEYALSDTSEIELCKFLERPMKDPIEHKPIPHCEKKISCQKCLRGEG
ncbi:MAG: metal-dependent transcriptional regulator [Candidatus Micrarchaeota archaeon]|nr:metal-dependent transcriptional regulator [Candidatus Micrarchaeota archaeon]